jgi:hypothetical protein
MGLRRRVTSAHHVRARTTPGATSVHCLCFCVKRLTLLAGSETAAQSLLTKCTQYIAVDDLECLLRQPRLCLQAAAWRHGGRFCAPRQRT